MGFYQAREFTTYMLNAKTAHGVHSPFVFELLHDVLDDSKRYYGFEHIETIRRELAVDRTEIEVTDLGAGSKSGNAPRKSIRLIARSALNREKYCRALYRLVNFANANTIVELGTSLGISTAYLASANSNTKVHSIEGCPNISRVAQSTIDQLKLKNVQLYVGAFEDQLNPLLHELGQIDLAFIDGNHKMAPTLNYFEQLLPFCHPHSVLVFDDIHWSSDMNLAWRKIQADPRVFITIDIFEMGFVFLREGVEKQDFVLRY